MSASTLSSPQATRGLTVSAETMRHWLHEVGWTWTHAKLVANDDDRQRVNRLARVRWVCEQLELCEAMVFRLPWLFVPDSGGFPNGLSGQGELRLTPLHNLYTMPEILWPCAAYVHRYRLRNTPMNAAHIHPPLWPPILPWPCARFRFLRRSQLFTRI